MATNTLYHSCACHVVFAQSIQPLPLFLSPPLSPLPSLLSPLSQSATAIVMGCLLVFGSSLLATNLFVSFLNSEDTDYWVIFVFQVSIRY